ncbi:hypothetical protein [Hymenobacter antarcticus]|uniref:Uncharacterized protein n=1 Tax=Hymenobacter antarcticus TaxID=486270 RepID=A0ABP7PQB3_9BACT
MTRNRSTSRRGWWALLLLLALASGPRAQAQPTAGDSSVRVPIPAEPASNWPWMLGLLVGGIALGVLGARLLGRKSQPVASGAAAPAASDPLAVPATALKRPAENVVVRPPVVQSLRGVQGNQPVPPLPNQPPRPPAPGSKPKQSPPKQNSKKTPSSRQAQSWPANVPHRPSAMNPTQPPVPAASEDQPLETGQTVEWAAPTSTPPAIQEMLDASAAETAVPAAPATEAAATAPAVASGPVHYYAPAPDVPSIEHRKLSPNPLPQMPLIITLPHGEANTAQFSFSPQADQSRIIGNGVRELKEFFAFELPPTEQFTTIKNLTPGKLEKRDDAWHVVQKAEIALS